MKFRLLIGLSLFLCLNIIAQKKGKDWFLLDSVSYEKLSVQDKYLFDSILPLYHKSNVDSIKLRQVMLLANSIGDENIWPRYNRLALKMAEKGGNDKVFLIYKSYALSNIGFELTTLRGDSKTALEIFEKNLKLQTDLGDSVGITATMNNMADIYLKNGNVDKAIDLQLKTLEIRERRNDQLGVGTTLMHLGTIYKSQGDLAGAVNCFSKALRLYEKINEKKDQGNVLNNLGQIYQGNGEHAKALEYFQKAKMLLELVGEKQSMARVLNNIGEIYLYNGEKKNALEKYKEGKRLSEEIGDKNGIASAMLYIAAVFKDENEMDSALAYFSNAVPLFEETGNLQTLSSALTQICEVYLKKGEVSKAEAYGSKALSLASKFGFPKLVKDPARLLYKIYRQQNKTEKALEMHELWITMKDSLNRMENKKAILRQQFKYDYDKKAAADSLHQAEEMKFEQTKHEHEIAKQRLFTYGGIAGFALMLMVAIISYRAFRLKKQTTKEITLQKHIIEEKQKEIIDSINYARRIQASQFPSEKLIERELDRLNRNDDRA